LFNKSRGIIPVWRKFNFIKKHQFESRGKNSRMDKIQLEKHQLKNRILNAE